MLLSGYGGMLLALDPYEHSGELTRRKRGQRWPPLKNPQYRAPQLQAPPAVRCSMLLRRARIAPQMMSTTAMMMEMEDTAIIAVTSISSTGVPA